MKDEIILKLINSNMPDLILGMNYLAEKSLLEITEFFDNYAEKRVRNYHYLLHPRLLIISTDGRGDTSYISNTKYDLIHCNNTLQLCISRALAEYYPKFIKL